jgi:hypothetical protein
MSDTRKRGSIAKVTYFPEGCIASLYQEVLKGFVVLSEGRFQQGNWDKIPSACFPLLGGIEVAYESIAMLLKCRIIRQALPNLICPFNFYRSKFCRT